MASDGRKGLPEAAPRQRDRESADTFGDSRPGVPLTGSIRAANKLSADRCKMVQSISSDSNVPNRIADEDMELDWALTEILRFADAADNLADAGSTGILNRVFSEQRQPQVPMANESPKAEVEWSWL